VKRLLFIFILFLLPAAVSHAQFREESQSRTRAMPVGAADETVTGVLSFSDIGDTVAVGTEPSGLTKVLYLTGATAGFALFDYVCFNLVRTSGTMLPAYRVVQVLVQAGISWFLYRQVGLPTAIAFNVVWWTWGADAVYYGYAEMFNASGHWERRGSFQRSIMENHCTWAWWTPVGVARGMDNTEVIAGDTLVAQSLFGAALALTLTLSF
jgi:hypothetical protein